MKMRQFIISGLVLISAAVAPTLMADTIVLYQDAYSYPVGFAGGNSGGEFNAITAPTSYLGDYSPLTAFDIGHGVGFETFCVQVNVEFNTSQVYNYTLSQNMQLNSSTQPLTMGTAYLYYLFATGSPLLGYDYLNPGNRLADAGLLQSAIWDMEGGQSWSGDPFDPATNPYYLLALAQFGGLSGADAASNGAFGVEIMNLTDANGNAAQDQLVLVPDGGSTILLLGLGFTGLALAGLRFRKMAA